MPFLMVSAVREPTVMAPSISKMVPRTIACLYEMDLDETLVAQEFATSSARKVSILLPMGKGREAAEIPTCTIVEGIEQGKQGANGKDVGVLVEHRDQVPAEVGA